MKTKTTSLFTTLLIGWAVTFLTQPLQAQTYTGDATLTTQAQVDAFSYSEVTGDLVIQDDGSEPIGNLDGLSSLSSVGGDLDIVSNAALANLDGLSSLSSVGGDLLIGFNPALPNLDGLSSLTSVGGDLGIAFNLTLANLDGLSSLSSVGGVLGTKVNLALNSFCGLYPLLSGGGLAGDYYVCCNLANPSELQILAAGPCGPEGQIQALVDAGILNAGQANALVRQAGRSLNGLAGHLIGLVNAGILTETQAQLILVLASVE